MWFSCESFRKADPFRDTEQRTCTVIKALWKPTLPPPPSHCRSTLPPFASCAPFTLFVTKFPPLSSASLTLSLVPLCLLLIHFGSGKKFGLFCLAGAFLLLSPVWKIIIYYVYFIIISLSLCVSFKHFCLTPPPPPICVSMFFIRTCIK